MAKIIEIAGENYEVDIAGNSLVGVKIAPVADDGFPLQTLEQAEDAALLRALSRYRGNKKRTAAFLGIDRRTLYRKLDAMTAKARAQ